MTHGGKVTEVTFTDLIPEETAVLLGLHLHFWYFLSTLKSSFRSQSHLYVAASRLLCERMNFTSHPLTLPRAEVTLPT